MSIQQWVVQADSREMRFTGEQLAHVSSKTPKKQRWIELALYRTVGGNYVYERKGMSLVKGEHTIHFAQVCETPTAVIETLYSRDDDGAWFFSHPSRALMDEASQHDDALRAAWRVEHVE